MAIQSINDGQSDRKPISSELHKIILAKVQKGYKFLLKKIKSAYLHIMSFITIKFNEILLSGFSGVVLTNCFSSIFHFLQISKFKKGHCSQKKKLNQNVLWICTSTHYVLLYYKVSGNSVERFQRSCADELF